jgi:fermentation-respiration switch protein FrsA (DUF1100 family)
VKALLASLLLAGLLGYLTVLAGMYVFQRRLLYHPDRSASPVPPGFSEVWLTSEDGLRLNAWFAPSKSGVATVLYLHGNAGNLGATAGRLQAYLDAGFGVLGIDWRGYGQSEGEPSEAGLYADGRAALAFLKEQSIPSSRVVLHGESLGSGVATLLATQESVAGLILEAPYLSVAEAAQYHYPYLPARWLVKDRFDNRSRVSRISAPILILHGEADNTVPVSHGRALLALAGERAEGHFFPGGGHMDAFDLGGKEASLRFIRQILEK